jgi:hypothetical protein
MSTPTNVVARYTSSGVLDRVIRDYSAAPGDTPVAIGHYDSTRILVLVENASSRRVELVAKDGSTYSSWIANATAMSAQVRDLAYTSDGGVLVSKGTAVEKFSSAGARITSGANPYINAPAAPCATATTLIPRVTIGPSDSIFFAHSAATPNNRIGIINSAGYSIAADCYAATAGPTVNHLPSAIMYHQKSGYLLVGYSNNTGPVNQIYSYVVTSNSIGAATLAYSNSSVLQGISVMTQDSAGNVYVGANSSSFNTVEKFTFNATTQTLTRVGTTPFIGPNIFTRSISAIFVE